MEQIDQDRSARSGNTLNIVYWSLAIEPILLAGIAIFLKAAGAAGNMGASASEEPVLIIFVVVSLVLAWLSLMFSTGKSIIPKSLHLRNNPSQAGYRIITLALAITPGIFGFVHFLIFGRDLSLLILNGGALSLAVWHITKFNDAG